MNNRINILRIENCIWIIYVIFAVAGIFANNLEIDDINNNNRNNYKKYHSINLILLFVSFIIYLYFIWLAYRVRKNTLSSKLVLIGSVLIGVAGLFYLIAELIDADTFVPEEL